MFVSVIGFSSMSYAQTDEWEEVCFYDLTSSTLATAGSVFSEVNEGLPFYPGGDVWVYENPGYIISKVNTQNLYSLTFYGSGKVEVEGKYFAVKQNVANGKYRISINAANWYPEGETFTFFYSKGDPASSETVEVSSGFTPLYGNSQNFISDEFEISDIDGTVDVYFGIAPKNLPYNSPNISFADFKLEKFGDGGTVEPVPTTYSVTVNPTNCAVSVTNEDGSSIDDLNTVAANTMLKVTVTPDANYEFGTLTYKLGTDGEETSLANEGTFELTDNAVITAVCNEAVAPVTEASYDDFCKPTAGTDGNKRYQTSGKVLDGVKLSTYSPLEFTPTGSKSNQEWANSDDPILAQPGATFNLKVSYGDAWGSLTVFQLRSDKESSSEDKIFGTYEGSWYSGVTGTDELYTNVSNDTESGAVASAAEKSLTFPISIPEDINVGEMVVVRFIVCKTTEGQIFDGNPCTADAYELNYCDYVVKVVDENYVPVQKYTVTIDKPQNGTLTVMNGDVAVNSGDKIESGTTLTITAKADDGYALKEVSANETPLMSVQGTYYVQVSGDTEISAIFEKLVSTYQVTVEKPANGNLSIAYETADGTQNINTSDFEEDSQLFEIEENTVLDITVVPDSDYELDKIYPEGMEEKSELNYVYTVTADVTISADFKAVQYASVVVNEPAEDEGSINVEMYDSASEEWSDASSVLNKVRFGTQLRFIVKAAEGYEVESVMNGDVPMTADAEDGYYYLTVDAETITISATFKDLSSIGEVSGNSVYYNSSEELLYTSAAKYVKVYDLSGRLVLSVENEDVVNVSGLTDGVYTAVVDGTVLKFVK